MNKENAYKDWFDMIVLSWTWARLTELERMKFEDEVENFCGEHSSIQILKGNYNQRWNILQALYSIYLDGLGYNHGKFREPEEN